MEVRHRKGRHRHLAQLRRSALAGLTLLEVLITATLAALVAILVFGSMLSAQQTVVDGTAMQSASSRARWIAEQVVQELRDLNYHTSDMNPTVFTQASSLDYRKVTGYDSSSQLVQLDPTRASGEYRTLELTSESKIVVSSPSGTRTLANRVAALELTLLPKDAGAGIEVERLLVRVVVELHDSRGDLVQGVAEVSFQLRNQIATGVE